MVFDNKSSALSSFLKDHPTLDERSFRFLMNKDPRWKISEYFYTFLSDESGKYENDDERVEGEDIFSVWRLTSNEAIFKMMRGDATGKGLDIKGKSARSGILSGFVPFLQIHSEESDKKRVSTLSKTARMRVFYQTADERREAVKKLEVVLKEMLVKCREAHLVVDKANVIEGTGMDDPDEWNHAFEILKWNEIENPDIQLVTSTESLYGIEIPERLLWEAFVMRNDILRQENTPMDVGRSSEPAFQDMNIKSSRVVDGARRQCVLYQYGSHNNDPLCPLTLLLAYEQDGGVRPVASDFDCFLVGTKAKQFKAPLPKEQVDVLKRMIIRTKEILASDESKNRTWTSNWLQMLKKYANVDKRIVVPEYGFGDPETTRLFESAAHHMKEETGAILHGAECFNFIFPQEIDDKFLVVDKKFPGPLPWRYLSTPDLLSYLHQKIKIGFTFPINPKWILCDPGWRQIYEQLCQSHHPHVQTSLEMWFPSDSGIRDLIKQTADEFPHGFQPTVKRTSFLGSTAEMDLAQLEYERYLTLQRAKIKLLAVLRIYNSVQKNRNTFISRRNTEAEEETKNQ